MNDLDKPKLNQTIKSKSGHHRKFSRRNVSWNTMVAHQVVTPPQMLPLCTFLEFVIEITNSLSLHSPFFRIRREMTGVCDTDLNDFKSKPKLWFVIHSATRLPKNLFKDHVNFSFVPQFRRTNTRQNHTRRSGFVVDQSKRSQHENE